MAKKLEPLFDIKDFLSNPQIKEHTAYLVHVSYGGGNPIHPAILFVGFKTGSYCQVYINNYDGPVSLSEVYYLEMVRELCSLDNIALKLPPRKTKPEPIGSDW